jgi:sporulation protein YlmC with PRC-barrel domain
MDTTNVSRDNTGRFADASAGPGPALMSTGSLTGNDVYNRDGEDLGDVKDFMIDMATGKIAYAVLSYGGLLGMGDKLFAVPWAALTLDTVNKRFTLNVNKDTLADAPGFDKDHWPSMSDKTWAGGVHTFYGMPYQVD